MPKNSAGTYTQPAGTAAVTDEVISASAFNTLVSDIATALTGDLPRAGGVAMSGDIPMGGNRVTGAGDAAARTDLVPAAMVADGELDFVGDISAADTKTAADNGFAPAAYQDGLRVRGRNVTANTGATTLNYAGLGAKKVFVSLDTGVAELSGGEYVAGQPVVHEYNTALDGGSGGWMLVNPAVNLGAGLAFVSTAIALSVANLAAITDPATDDQFAFSDTSNSGNFRRMTFENYLKIISALTEDTDPDTAADFIVTYDDSASAPRKVLPDNLGLGAKLLSTTTVSGTPSEVEITDIPSGYRAIMIVWEGVQKDASNTNRFQFGLSEDNGSSYENTKGRNTGVNVSNGAIEDIETGTGDHNIQRAASTANTTVFNGYLIIEGYAEAASLKYFKGVANFYHTTNGAEFMNVLGGTAAPVGAIDATRFRFNGGATDLAAGTFKVYGLR